MMKKTGFAALLLALTLLCAAAGAQTLPSIEVFSPGLCTLAELEKTQPTVTAEAAIKIDNAMYARDLSVLSAMLSGTTFAYQLSGGEETLTLSRGGETLGVYAIAQSDAVERLTGSLLGTAVLERVPLTSVAAWLEGLKAGDTLGFGFVVSEPFALERTMSDDGTRLTKINITGAIAREGEAPWRVEGFLRQPAGRTPKDTAELTITQDADNSIELLYSALRENEITRKDKAGTTSVSTSLKAAGKIGGYGISSRLTVNMKNQWTADGDALQENVTINASLGHTDKTPGRRMQRLNDVAAVNKNTIRLTTHESGDAQIAYDHALTLEVTMDGNTFLAGSADMTVCVGGDAQEAAQDAETITPESAKALARRIYQQLGETTLETIRKGL